MTNILFHLTHFSGLVYRKISVPNVAEYKRKVEQTPLQYFRGFTSTTTNRKVAEKWKGNVIYELVIHETYCIVGGDIQAFSHYRDENEILLGPFEGLFVKETLMEGDVLVVRGVLFDRQFMEVDVSDVWNYSFQHFVQGAKHQNEIKRFVISFSHFFGLFVVLLIKMEKKVFILDPSFNSKFFS